MRMGLEKVNGVYQGFAINYREGFQSGILRERFGLDGSMFVGMTSRGWGSTGKDDFGLQRLFWNGNVPFEIDMIKAKSDGFEFSFTQPVDVNSVKKAASYAIRSYIYKYQHQYGSPIIELKDLKIKGVEVSADRKKVRISIDGIRRFFIHEFTLKGVLNDKGEPLLHETAYYTLNEIPAGPALVAAAPEATIKTIVTARTVKNAMGYELGIAGLLKKHTCSACHAKDSKLIGPAFTEIAKRNYSNQKILELVYKPNPQNWPDFATEMAPMSHVPKADVLKIAGWINGLRETEGLKNHD
jgi:cytochrome c551/c552